MSPPIRPVSNLYYTTIDELAFIENLGQWGPADRRAFPTRAELLQRYLLVMAQRVDWGSVSRDIIEKRVKHLLRKEARHAPV